MLGRLAGADALLDQVDAGTMELSDAVDRLRQLQQAPSSANWETRAAMVVWVVGWVIFVDGLDLLTIPFAVVATVFTYPIDSPSSNDSGCQAWR